MENNIVPADQISANFDFGESVTALLSLIEQNPECRTKINKKLHTLFKTLYRTQKVQYPLDSALDPQLKAIKVERDRVYRRLKDFDVKGNRAWKEITSRYGTKLSHSELLAIATVISKCDNIKLDREAKRRKEVLIKWFDENIDRCIPYFNSMVLVDEGDHYYGDTNLRYYITKSAEAEQQTEIQSLPV